MSHRIEQGCLVVHSKLSGPTMMVVASDGLGTIMCHWFDKNHAFRVASFPADHLMVVTPGPPGDLNAPHRG